jgi:hypothetical protein
VAEVYNLSCTASYTSIEENSSNFKRSSSGEKPTVIGYKAECRFYSIYERGVQRILQP